jgi:hypothetical protein
MDSLNGEHLNSRVVPSHTIATWKFVQPSDLLKATLTKSPNSIVLYLLRDISALLLFNGKNDWIVAVESQQGGLVGSATSLVENQAHLGSAQNPEVMDKVGQLLVSSPTSELFSMAGFAPRKLSKPLRERADHVVGKINADADIKVSYPIRGQIVSPGSELVINITGNNITEIGAVVEYNRDSSFVAKVSGSGASLKITIDKTASGRKSIIVVGKTANGMIVADTTSFVISDNALPVQLIDFYGELYNEDVLINWSTSFEYQSSYFEIERSSDFRNFVVIGRVDAAGESNYTSKYRFIDLFPVEGINYYRLKQVDADGTTMRSRIIHIQRDNEFFIYPNPSSNIITVPICKECSELIIYDVYGRTVLRKRLDGTFQTISIDKLGSGMYIGDILNGTGKIIYRKKIVLENSMRR